MSAASELRARAKSWAWYWLRSVPNLALHRIWKHHGEHPHDGQEKT